MNRQMLLVIGTISIVTALGGCATKQENIVINSGSVAPGTMITRGEAKLQLLGNPIEVGQLLPASDLVDSRTRTTVNFADYRDKVLFLSIVPSIETKVCETQTHYLGEEGDKLPAGIVRFTISRDMPFAHMRFAQEAKLTDIEYLSDYKTGSFGQLTGLLIDGTLLLARAVIIADKQGIVRYIQVVPELSNLPDMEKAFAKAIELAEFP